MKKIAVLLGMVFLMFAVINANYVFAQPPHQEIIQRLDTIQQMLQGYCGMPKTGQTVSYSDYDDGYYEMGVSLPVPRFTDNGDGTISDHLTGLVWLKNADCFGQLAWTEALDACANLVDGDCGLTDGSKPWDWHLPNVKELQSLVHHGYHTPVITNGDGTGHWTQGDVFIDIRSVAYWSATTDTGKTTDALFVNIGRGGMSNSNKTRLYYVWPVRGGN